MWLTTMTGTDTSLLSWRSQSRPSPVRKNRKREGIFPCRLIELLYIIMSRFTHEVCIIGAGPVGLALANCLALSPHISRIALIDKKLPKIIRKDEN